MWSVRTVWLLALALPVESAGCSAAMCLNRGVEARPDFKVTVRHEGRPLPGTNVKVTGYADGKAVVIYSGQTDRKGAVRVTNLKPGDYWLEADKLGISAAYHCFHVATRRGFRARSRFNHTWGDFPVPIPALSGNVVDSQPGVGPSPLLNQIHRTAVPMSSVNLRLESALGDLKRAAVSDEQGAFHFEQVPPGIYVLHVEGGVNVRAYEPTDLLVRLSEAGEGQKLLLTRIDNSGCGDPAIRIEKGGR